MPLLEMEINIIIANPKKKHLKQKKKKHTQKCKEKDTKFFKAIEVVPGTTDLGYTEVKLAKKFCRCKNCNQRCFLFIGKFQKVENNEH
jgi:hypothetical protein